MGEQVVVAPQKGEDGDRGEGGFCRRDNDIEVNLEHAAPVQISAFLQLDRHGLDESHQHDDRKAQIPCDLRQNDCQHAQPAVPLSRYSHYNFHPENGDDRGEYREHHPAHDQAVKQSPSPELIAGQSVSRQSCQNDHDDRHRAGDQKAVEISIFEVGPLPSGDVILPGESIAQRQGKGVAQDQPLLAEGVQNDPDEGINGRQRPEPQNHIDQNGGNACFLCGFFLVSHAQPP